MKQELAFLGLGAMGAPMAERLAAAGHPLRVFDPNAVAVSRLAAMGAVACSSVADAAKGAANVLQLWFHAMTRGRCADDDTTLINMIEDWAGVVVGGAPSARQAAE